MAWSLESVLQAVVNAPAKALAKLNPQDLEELPARLAEARANRRPDVDEAQRLVLLACLAGAAEILPPDDVAWALAAKPRLPEPRHVACLERMTPAQRLALVDALPDERVAWLGRMPEDARRAVVLADPARWPFDVLTQVLLGDAGADAVLWEQRERFAPSWAGQAAFVFALRPARRAWLEIPPVLEHVLETVAREGWTRFDASFGESARRDVLDHVEAAVDGPDSWAVGWLERVAPERAAAVLERLLGPAPAEPPLDTTWVASAFPGGVPTTRAAFLDWLGDDSTPSTADLDGFGYVHRVDDGDRQAIRMRAVPMGLLPERGPLPWAAEQDWQALAKAHAFARDMAARADEARIGPGSDGEIHWRRAVIRTDAPLGQAIEDLLDLPPGQANVHPFHRREAFDRGGARGRAIEALFASRTREPAHVDVDQEVVGVSPEFVLGRMGPYLAGIFCVRVWT